MVARRIQRFLGRPWKEKVSTAQFFVRQALAGIPYLPVKVRLPIAPNEEIRFRWSYVVPFHDPGRRFFDYWGHDGPELRMMWKILKAGMVFLDIGAYHGIYSLVAAKRLGAAAQVVAFEPSAEARRRLRMHLRWNGIDCVKVESRAVSSARSTATFFEVVSGDETRNGLRPPSSADVVAPVTVGTLSLDEYVAEAGLARIDLVKLDVEGGELEVLAGATRVLKEFRPVFICEVLDAAAEAWGYQAKETVARLQSFGYEWFEFQPDGTLSPHTLREAYPEVRNYLAVPSEKRSDVLEWSRP
jgi:FkbM family methyltransferase